MSRYIEVILEKRGVTCVARLLDEEAPKTAEAVWRALPQSGDVYHAKYANHEIYTLVPVFPDTPGFENRTITPIPGDLVYFYIRPGTWVPREAADIEAESLAMVDLAVFYDRNNLLFSPVEGAFPGNVFGTIVKNLEAMKEAGYRIWREGGIGERLIFRRLEGEDLKQWGLQED